MEIVHGLLVLLHLVGFAALFGGAFVQVKGPTRVINPAMWHGALTLLVSGLLLVAVVDIFGDGANHMKVGIKFLVLVGIFVLVLMNRKKQAVAPGIFFGILGLTLLNAALAVLW